MSLKPDERLTIRKYLLGQLDGEGRREFEEQLLVDDDLFNQLAATEGELIDEYLAGELMQEEAEMFGQRFLQTPERRQKASFARAFRQYAGNHRVVVVSEQPLVATSRSWWQSFTSSPLAGAAIAVVLILIGVGAWRVFFHKSDVDNGLIALNNAYRQQRPLEARITKLDYAPFVMLRGNESPQVDSRELEISERYLLDAIRDHPSVASHHALGKLYLTKRDFDKAILEFDEALKTDPNNAQVHADLGATFLESARLSLQLSDQPQTNPSPTESKPSKSGEYLGRALENLNQALQLDGNLLEAQFNRALCYQYMPLHDRAIAEWKNYLQKDGASRWADEARRNLQLLENQKANAANNEQRLFAEFQSAYDSRDDNALWTALTLSRSRAGNLIVDRLIDDYLANDTDKAAKILAQLEYLGRLELARSKDRFTLDISDFCRRSNQQQRDALSQARGQMKSGIELFNHNEFDEAIGTFSLARNYFEKIGDRAETVAAESWEGFSRLRVPTARDNIEIFERILEESKTQSYRDLEAQALNALADANLSNNEYSHAQAYVSDCLQLSEQIADPATQMRCLTQSQSLQIIFGEYSHSLESMREILAISERLPRQPKLVFPVFHEAALAANSLDLRASALAFEEEALRMADELAIPYLRSRALERLGLIYGKQRNFEAALRSGESALNEAYKIKGDATRTNMLAHSMLSLGYVNLQAGNLENAISYFDQSLALYQDARFSAYSYTAHKGKFLALNGLNKSQAASEELTTVLKLFENARTQIVEESNRDKFFDTQQDTYDMAADFEFSKISNEAQAFNYAEASKARSLFEMMTTGVRFNAGLNSPEITLTAQTTPLTLPEIQQQMPEPSQLIQYAVLPDKVLIWVVGNSLFVGKATPLKEQELEQTIHVFDDSIARGAAGREDFLKSSKQLYQWLIAPVVDVLKGDRQLFIIPDKSLNFLPFAALLSSSSGHYLIEDFQLEMAPSATVFIAASSAARDRQGKREERILSIGNPRIDQSESLPDLPGATREAEQSAGFYPQKTVLLKGDATKRKVEAALTNADVAHFATHAVSYELSPLLSRLLLAHDDSPRKSNSGDDLSSAEIYQLKVARTRLVVLSACQTGIERAYNGEGAIGLARPFLAARVPLVVASFWPVDSELTAELMVQFHRFRKEQKLGTAAALQQAQLAMLHNPQPAFREDSGWAAFTVIGGYAPF